MSKVSAAEIREAIGHEPTENVVRAINAMEKWVEYRHARQPDVPREVFYTMIELELRKSIEQSGE